MRRPGQQRDLMQFAAAVVASAAAAQPVGIEAGPGADLELTNHRVRRDGGVWLCSACGGTWPFPSPLPDDAGSCTPRKWGDQDAD